MPVSKIYAEDVVGGAVTSVLGTTIVAVAQQYGTPSAEFYLFIAAILFLVFYLVKFLTRWLYFYFLSGLREACGLFLEIYVAERGKQSTVVVAPMVVYFDVREDALAITGHAFRLNKTQFESYANWHSLVTYVKPHKDDFGVFYLHDGELVGETPDEIPGTTFCRLPKRSAMRCRRGYFCDLVQINRSLNEDRTNENSSFGANYFEIVRAPVDLEMQFLKRVTGLVKRSACLLKIASPQENAYRQFIELNGISVILDASVERGPIMQLAQKIAKAHTA
jgi:hypothetical protein